MLSHDIMTEQAFENAIAVALSRGVCTNSLLHLIAMAYEGGVELSI